MPLMPSPERRVLLAADMQRYSRQSNLDQHRSQKVFHEVMRQAANHAGLHREAWITQSSGDGEFSVLPAGTLESVVISDFVPALEKLLREHNRALIPELRTRLRVALHTGLVHLDGANGVPGLGAIHVNRLVDAPPLKEALNRHPNAVVGLIVSDSIYHECVSERYEGIRPEQFHNAQVDVKEFSETAWIHLPGEDVTGMDRGFKPPATSPDATQTQSGPGEDRTRRRGAEPGPTRGGDSYTVQENQFQGPVAFGPGASAVTRSSDDGWGA